MQKVWLIILFLFVFNFSFSQDKTGRIFLKQQLENQFSVTLCLYDTLKVSKDLIFNVNDKFIKDNYFLIQIFDEKDEVKPNLIVRIIDHFQIDSVSDMHFTQTNNKPKSEALILFPFKKNSFNFDLPILYGYRELIDYHQDSESFWKFDLVKGKIYKMQISLITKKYKLKSNIIRFKY